MLLSQNGYSVIDSYDDCKYYRITDKLNLPLRKGNAGYVLAHFLREFHENVEPLGTTETFGYNKRQISGSSDWSNHASGTAVDANSAQHAYGKVNTFTRMELNDLRRLLADYDGVIKWGGDYRYTKDEMHFEIDRGKEEVDLVARRLKRNNTVRLFRLQPGKRNIDTYMVKRELERRGYDAGVINTYFGRGLRRGYAKWQESLGYTGLDADGIPGRASLEALGFTVI